MCGLAGIIGFGLTSLHQDIKTMTQAIAHRGPDDEGYHLEKNAVLGHRRLSVIDLAQGKQPISNEDGSIWIVFNGEIYNFQELRADLLKKGHLFKTNSDTEVIVHLYEEYPDFVKRLDGMFAFAIWDSNKQKLVLARDRIGKKPLFYAKTKEAFYFASELKALLCLPQVSKKINLANLNHFFSLNYLPQDRTLIENVSKLMPGHILELESSLFKISPFWSLPVENPSELIEEADVLPLLEQALERSVKKRLISEVPLGVFLSGGIDSSLVVGALRRLGIGNIKTFTIGFKNKAYDETKKARIVADFFKTDHHEYVLEPQLSDILPKVIWHTDEPSGDSSAFPTYLLSEVSKKEITVAFSGDGGDEFFAGYHSYNADRLCRKYRYLPMGLRKSINKAVHLLPSLNHPIEGKLKRFFRGSVLPPVYAHAYWQNRMLLDEDRQGFFSKRLSDAAAESDPFSVFLDLAERTSFEDSLDLFMYLDQKTLLPEGILAKVDRMSMAHGLEVRCPLLDSEIIKLSYQIPARLKLKNGIQKYLLKKLLGRFMPDELFSKKKKGFSIPANQWLREDLKDLMCDALLSERFLSMGLVQPDSLEKIIHEHIHKKNNHSHILWTLMVFSIWSYQHKLNV